MFKSNTDNSSTIVIMSEYTNFVSSLSSSSLSNNAGNQSNDGNETEKSADTIGDVTSTDRTQKELPLLLPSLSHNANDDNTRTLNVDGDSIGMPELGPIIINSDGTTRRIANWDILSPQERESSWRLISARNKKRIGLLKQRLQQEQEQNLGEEKGTPSDVIDTTTTT